MSLRARIRAGDAAAFGELFDADAGAVYRHAVRVLADRASAEDVVSLTFLEAWRLRGRILPGDEPLRPWLFGIATNVLRNTARAARRHRAALARLPAREPVPDIADDVVGRLADGATVAAAKRALAELRPAERDVFTLCVWSGLSYAEAADALGIALGTVRSRLARARTKLRAATAELAVPTGQVPGGRVAARPTQENVR